MLLSRKFVSRTPRQ